MESGKLRSVSRYAIAFSIGLLLAASLGFHSLEMSIASVIVTLLANGVLISYATRGVSGGDYSAPSLAEPQQPELDRRTCALGYAMVPISAISIICLALYKAEADALEDHGTEEAVDTGRREATQEAAVAFLNFVGCGGMIEDSNKKGVRETVLELHTRFIGAAILAAIAYIVIVGLRVFFGSELNTYESRRSRDVRNAARMAFLFAIALLVFAVIGFYPLIFTSAACAVSLAASAAMLCSAVEPPEPELADLGVPGVADQKTLSVRTQLQAHSFSFVTLCCLYCLGCMVLERMAIDDVDTTSKARQVEVRLQFVGFELSFAAATWFALTLAVRAYFKTTDAARSGR